jgi:hypothetical protein
VRRLSLTEAKICAKLWRQGKFGAGHIQIDTLVQGLPSHETGAARDAVDQMIREGILVKKGKARAAVHLNVNFAGPIYDRIREHPQFAWLPK